MSELDGHYVKRGLWTNHNHSPVVGTVITTDTRTGTVIIALLAVLSALGASHLWHLIAFAYHQSRAHGKPRDGLFRQQQALLRQLPTPGSLVADSVKLWWLWRRRTDRALVKTISPLLLAAVCALGTLATSISSSYVVDSLNLEVLVSSPFCGRLNVSVPIGMTGGYNAAVLAVSDPYAQECYDKANQNGTFLPARCRVYVNPNVPLKVDKVQCPFSTEMCVRTGSELSPAIAVDSGLVDINKAFGLNLADKDRMKYRKRTVCGVLPTKGHTTVINATDLPSNFLGRPPLSNEELILYHYSSRPGLKEWGNITFITSLVKANVTREFSLGGGYIHFASMGPQNSFSLLPEMERKDADVGILNVGKNSVIFLSPVEDLIFSAHKKSTILDSGTQKNFTIYYADDPYTGVACAQQYQFCASTPGGEKCSELNGLPSEISSLGISGASDVQSTILEFLVESSRYYYIGSNNAVRASSMMESQGVVSVPVPSNQWIAEITGWESYVWAALQTRISDYAIGPQTRTPEAEAYTIRPNSTGYHKLCGVQRMRKPGGFVNINVFGLVFIIVISSLAAIIDMTGLNYLLFRLFYRKIYRSRIERWVQDGVLQLQRRAYEAQGEGVWTDLDKDVPVTVEKYFLADLPVESLPLSK